MGHELRTEGSKAAADSMGSCLGGVSLTRFDNVQHWSVAWQMPPDGLQPTPLAIPLLLTCFCQDTPFALHLICDKLSQWQACNAAALCDCATASATWWQQRMPHTWKCRCAGTTTHSSFVGDWQQQQQQWRLDTFEACAAICQLSLELSPELRSIWQLVTGGRAWRTADLMLPSQRNLLCAGLAPGQT